jgi:hypothetical protein
MHWISPWPKTQAFKAVHLVGHAKDEVFPNNWFSTHCDGRIVLYPMKVPSRAAEVRPDFIETVRRTVGMGDGFSTSFNQTLLETGKEVMK